MPTVAALELKVESKEVTKAAKANDELDKSGKKVAKSAADASKAEDKQAASSKKVARSGKAAADSNTKQSKTAARLQKQYAGLQRSIAGVAASFLAFQTAREAIAIIADFGEAIAVVRALGKVAGATAEELAKLSAQARALGASTRFTATQATQAQAALLRGGLDTQEAFEATAATLDLAIAGLLSLERAAEITAITLNQFNLAANQSGRVADVLVAASSRSATNVEQLAEALKFVAPIAAGFGATLEDTAGALQVLANAGLRASIAGTNLRGAFARLASPTGKAARQIEILAKASGQSVDAFDVTKNSLGEVFQAFQDAKAGPKELLQIFGRLQAPGALALTRAGKEIDKFSKDLDGAEGAAASFREELQKELKDNLFALASALQNLVLVINDQFGPALISTVRFMTEVVNALSASDEKLKALSPAAIAAAKHLKSLALVAGIFAAAKLAVSIGAAATAMITFIRTLKVLRATLISTGIGALVVVLGILAGIALDAAGAFDAIDKKAGAAEDQLAKLAAAEKGAEQSRRQAANSQRQDDERALAAAEKELDAEKVLEDERKKNAKAAAERARQRRRQAETARQQLQIQEIDIFERIDTAGLDRGVAELRKAQEEFTRLFATSKELTLEPGEGFFGALERQIKNQERRNELEEEFAEGLKFRSAAIAEAQRREDTAARASRANEAFIGIAEALDDARFSLANLNATGLDRVVIDTFREFREELEAIKQASPELLSGVREELTQLAQTRFLQTLNEALRETLGLMQQLEDSGPRTKDAFQQFAAAASTAIANFRTQLQLPGADIEALNALIEDTQKRVKQFSGEVARAEGFRQLEDAVTIVTRSFLGLFQTLITGSDNAGEAFGRFIQSVTQALFQRFVVEQIIGAIGAGFGSITGSAKGNVFRSGNVEAFANGGVIGGPTLFPLGLAGEDGPEAILPLQRGPDGRLGVAAQTGGDRPSTNPFVLRSASPGASSAPTTQEVQRGVSRTINVQQNIQTPDASSFRRSSRQISDLALQSVRV